jgi:hypothetical protein
MRSVILFLIALAVGGLVDAVKDVASAIREQAATCSAPNPVPLVEETHS